MAEEETTEEEKSETEASPPKSKKGLMLGGGAIAVVAVAAIGAFLAVPGTDKVPSFEGPFVMPLAEEIEAVTVNLKGEGARRFLVMTLQVEYDAYKELYGTTRIADPLYLAKLQDRLLTIASQKTSDEVLELGTQEIFLEEMRVAVEPLLFPVHVGLTQSPSLPDPESGLKPGFSIHESTMRGPVHEHSIEVDATEKKMRLNDGEFYEFDGTEEDLQLKDSLGRTVFVDVTGLKEDFVGEVPVGVQGRVRNLLKVKFIIQ